MPLFTTDPKVRFQNCTPLTQWWRRRYLLAVPYQAVRSYFRGTWAFLTGEDDEYDSFRIHWSISHGCAHVQMNWVYSMDEVFDRLKLGQDPED